MLLEREATYRCGDRVERASFALRLCTRCHLAFVDPAPPEDMLASFYTSDYAYYAAAGDHPSHEAGSWKYKLARMRYLDLTQPSATNRARSLLAVVAELLARKTITFTLGVPLTMSTSSRILDYGYGTGSWLLAMSLLGYSHLAGYDLASNAHRREELAANGIQVVPPGGLSELTAHSLDCVRLEHVFEHLPDPLGVLRMLHRLLRPHGRLLMTFPSIYPWLRVKDLVGSPFLDYLQVPVHLAHHSLESSSRLLRAAGFEVAASRITRRERFITLMARKQERPGSSSKDLAGSAAS